MVDSKGNEIVAYSIWTYLSNGYNYVDDPELFREGSSSPEWFNTTILKDFPGKLEGLRRKYAEGIRPP